MSNEIIGEIGGVIEKTQGNQKYLFGTIKSDKIKNITFVPVIEPSRRTPLNEVEEGGYQRPGSLSRMRAFAKFLQENPDSVVPPVLLSGRGKWQFQPGGHEHDSGQLIIQDRAAVIDGQHRLGGFVHLYESENDVRDISFILLPNLSEDNEKKEFIVVNNTQKGVPRPLTAYLEETDEAQVAWGLNEDSDSPFKDRITRTTMQRTQLFSLHSVAKQVKRLFTVAADQDLDPNLDIDQRIEFVSRFWTIIADQLDTEWSDIDKLEVPGRGGGRQGFDYKLLELTGLVAWAYTGAQIFSRSYSEETGMNWDNVRRLVKAASGIDWRKEGEYAGRTGEAGGRLMSGEMIRMLPAEGAMQSLEEEPPQ